MVARIGTYNADQEALLKSIEKILLKHDLEDLVKTAAPNFKYSGEAEFILYNINKQDPSIEEISVVVNDVFNKFFDYRHRGRGYNSSSIIMVAYDISLLMECKNDC